MKTVIIGGGAAGFFLAVNLKEMCPEMQVSIFERSEHVLSKVKISGGGRCNCTNTFEQIGENLQKAYPRGHRLMKRLFNHFDYDDTYEWFTKRGVPLVTQPDCCVFPQSQDSQSIINLFLNECKRLQINIITKKKIDSLDDLDAEFICVTIGGQPRKDQLQWLGHPIETPVPSLFTLSINDSYLTNLTGTVVEHCKTSISGTKIQAEGPLLITHWGMSGPCILRLSSYAARLLNQSNYQLPLTVNWTGNHNENDVRTYLQTIFHENQNKKTASLHPFSLPSRLYTYLVEKAIGKKADHPCKALNNKDLNRLSNILVNDTYQIASRAPFKDEFVTCGGISLQSVNPQTLESKLRPHLFFAGEVLDIDGITGGFNFQAAWTTAYTVALAIHSECT